MPLDRRQLKRNLRLFAIARSDLVAAQRCVNLLQQVIRVTGADAIRQPEFAPLQHALVITYARPFTPTKTSQRLTGRWARFEDPRLNRAHATALRMRNSFVAHSDEEQRQVTIIPPGAPAVRGHKMRLPADSEVVGIRISSQLLPTSMIDALAHCCRDVGGRLNQEVWRLQGELYDGRTDLPSEPFLVTDDDGL